MSDKRTYGAHARAVAVLGLPLIGSHLAQVAMGITDALMLGWYDVEALAAVTLAFSIYFILFIVGSGFALAVMPMVATAIGAGDTTQVRRVTRMGIWVSVIYGVALMPPLIWAKPFLIAIGQTPEISEIAQSYTRIVAFGLVPALLVMVLKSYLSALERAQVVLWITLAAAVVNAGANYVLIFGKFGAPELGAAGAAIASLAMIVVSLGAMAVYVARATPEHAMFQRLWKSDPEAFAHLFRLGWPIGLTLLAESGLFSASAIMMGWIGTDTLAAHGIAIQLASMMFVVHLGLSQAATVRSGSAYGRRDKAGLIRGSQVAVAFSLSFACLTIILFLTVPEFLLGLFIDPGDPRKPTIVAIGVGLLVAAAIFQLADGAQVVALGLLRGVHDTKVPMIHATVSYWLLGMPASYILAFPMGFGGIGVWMGLIIGLTAAGILLTHRFWFRMLPRIMSQEHEPTETVS